MSDLVRHSRGLVQIHSHRIQRLDEIPDLVIAGGLDLSAEITDGHRVGKAHRAEKRPADVQRHPDGGTYGNDQRCKNQRKQSDGGTAAVDPGLLALVGHLFLDIGDVVARRGERRRGGLQALGHGPLGRLGSIVLCQHERLILDVVRICIRVSERLDHFSAGLARAGVDLVFHLQGALAELGDLADKLVLIGIGRQDGVLFRSYLKQYGFLKLADLRQPSGPGRQVLGRHDHIVQLHIGDASGDHGEQDDDAERAGKLGFDGESHINLVGSNWGAYA